jgi:S1-C subfamily serine protease
VASVGRLIGRLDDFKAGDTIRLGVLRDGARIELRATLQPGS